MRQPDTRARKLRLDYWEGLLDVHIIKALICSECVGVLSGLVVGLHGPFDDGAVGQIGLMLRCQIPINLRDGLFRIWMGAWLLSWMVAFPALLLVQPLVRRIMGWIVEKP